MATVQDERLPLTLLWSEECVARLCNTSAGAMIVAFRREAAVLYKAVVEPVVCSPGREALFAPAALTVAQSFLRAVAVAALWLP
eukprot:471532-Prymnesium_polylepis.1